MPVMERRDVLAALVGRRVRVRAVAARGAVYWGDGESSRRTLAVRVVRADTGADLTPHAWVNGADVIRAGLVAAGDVFEADCVVYRYSGVDPSVGYRMSRYGLRDPAAVVSLGPADLRDLLGELVRLHGFDAVADSLAGLHGG